MDKLEVFEIDPNSVSATNKSDQPLDEVDEVAAKKGYVSRDPQPKKRKPRNPRTEQIHTWVRPHVKEELLAESVRRGIHQGFILEEAWDLYRKQIA